MELIIYRKYMVFRGSDISCSLARIQDWQPTRMNCLLHVSLGRETNTVHQDLLDRLGCFFNFFFLGGAGWLAPLNAGMTR